MLYFHTVLLMYIRKHIDTEEKSHIERYSLCLSRIKLKESEDELAVWSPKFHLVLPTQIQCISSCLNCLSLVALYHFRFVMNKTYLLSVIRRSTKHTQYVICKNWTSTTISKCALPSTGKRMQCNSDLSSSLSSVSLYLDIHFVKTNR